MKVLTRQELKSEPYNLPMAFIKRHDAQLGGFGKPRRYVQQLVDAELLKIATKGSSVDAERLVGDIQEYINQQRDAPALGGREMRGRGGNFCTSRE